MFWGERGGGTKVMRISRQPSPIQLENVEYFNYVGSMVTNYVTLPVILSPGLPWKKEHSTVRRTC
jgi:hypothetical protein